MITNINDLKNKDIVELEVNKEINCSKEVAQWNYWDCEHVDVVHSGYKSSHILHIKDNHMFGIHSIKIPLLPFISTTTPIFMVQDNEDEQYSFTILFGVVSRTTITIKSLERSKCAITMNYKFYCNGWRKIFKPFIKYLMPIWNERVWQEDYNIKIRRQKMLDMNFKDFTGLPKDLNDRILNDFKERKLKLPIPRPRNSSRDRHPLKVK